MNDLNEKKQDSNGALDLSKNPEISKEDFKKLMEKVPDFKIKPEKVNIESIKIKDKTFRFKSGKKDLKAMKQSYTFLDPLPRELQHLKIKDLAIVPIDWKMLTTVRPKTKLEENYFSKLVELKKSELKTRAYEKRQFALDPQIRKTKNKAGILEMRVVSCDECQEDFCNGKICKKINYDFFTRKQEVVKPPPKVTSSQTIKKIRIKRRKKKKSKAKNRSKTKDEMGSPKKNSTNSN